MTTQFATIPYPTDVGSVSVTGLTVSSARGQIVAPFDLTIAPSSTLAIIGESGSGKTLSAKAIAGLLPRGVTATGILNLGGVTIDLPGTDASWRAVRGRRVSLLLQDPFTSLSPVHRCGAQIAMTLQAASGRRISPRELAARVGERLVEVNLPAHVATAYPHELSGGMRQRVAIAAALAADPTLLIADEPTTALDAANQGEILDLLRRLQDRRGMSVLLISHDLGLVRGRSDEVLVMRAGEVVERGATSRILHAPEHEYTRALLDADPALSPLPLASPSRADADAGAGADDLVAAHALTKSLGGRRVLRGVDIRVERGESVGIVGESGSGKTTLARCIAGLEQEDSGRIVFAGAELKPGRRGRTPEQMQIVFQDPYSSLNPMMTIGQILREALGVANRPASDIAEMLSLVGLPTEFSNKRPSELSGGQRQRIAIARALAPSPRLLICDESVSALDVSVQAQVLDLLSSVRAELGISILFISHDLAVVGQVTDRVYVLKDGAIVEEGETSTVLGDPQHSYTQSLVAASGRERN